MTPEITLGTFISVAAINAAIRGAVPIILGAMSGIVSERSGIVNIAIEGMMLFGAYAAFYANVALSRADVAPFLREQPIRLGLAILAAALIGMALALLHAVLSIRFKVDQIISGTVINIFALGMTGYLYEGGQNVIDRLPPVIRNPFATEQGFMADFGAIIFDKGILTYTAFALVPILGFLLFRTTWGLRTRSVGENPRAADTLGVNVHRLQFTNLAVSGVLAGLAGAVLVLEGVSFERGMSNGRGFIALAVMIFGAWRPSRVLFGALLFGYATALQSQLQFAGVQIPHQFVAMLPYVLTLIVLAGFMGRARPPAHIGRAYETE